MTRNEDKRPSIKELPEDERPRERLIWGGAAQLSDTELLAIIIGSGTVAGKEGKERYTALDLARALLKRYKSLRELAQAGVSELRDVPGIGYAKAAQVKAALEIARRFASTRLTPGKKFGGPHDIFNHFKELLGGEKKECFCLVLLDRKHKIISWKEISRGTLDQSLVHPREVFKEAIRDSAAAVAFVHNHPSGDPEPSNDDISITRRLKEVADLLGIKVLDHVIIGNEEYVSFADRRLL